MKTKKLLTMLLLVVMMLAMVGTVAGCGGNDDGDDKKVEEKADKQDKTDDKKDAEEEPQATATPEPTATPTPEVLPTVDELFDANEGMFLDKTKITMKFAYKGPMEYGDMTMEMDAELLSYENISYEKSKIKMSVVDEAMGIDVTENMDGEAYYVDDEETSIRTEYSFDTENQVWVKSQYAYVEADSEGYEDDFPVDEMSDIKITCDGDMYYLTGIVGYNMWGDAASLGIDGLELGSTACEFKFDKETKKVISVDFVVKFDTQGMEENVTVDDWVVVLENLEEPIVIPEEVLAAELVDDLW